MRLFTQINVQIGVLAIYLTLTACSAMAKGPTESADGTETEKKMSSISELRKTVWANRNFKTIEKQALDMSCGASSLASLTRHYTKLNWYEKDVIDLLTEIVPQQRQNAALQNGFSLMDLKLALNANNYDLKAAFWVHKAMLLEFNSPALLQLSFPEGNHFVLWHGMYKDYHWVSDPSRGDLWLSSDDLFKNWTMVAAWVFKDDLAVEGPSNEKMQRQFSLR